MRQRMDGACIVVYGHDRGKDSGETDLSYRIIWYRIVPVRYCTYLPRVTVSVCM